MFSFLNDLDALNQSDFKFSQNFKHTILHPYKDYDD